MQVESMTNLIGNTPVLKLNNISKKLDLNANLFAKLEYFNPAGSVKDRIALSMIEKGIKEGKIKEDSVLIEPTSGNTGIGLASICASKGLKLILTMPETMSVERRNLLKAYGAEIVLTDGALGMKGTIEKANELLKKTNNAFMPSQFTNSANPQIHYETTGPELYNDSKGKIDIFVAGVGTGGTITGVSKFLKEKIKGLKAVAVEPMDSPVLSEGKAGPHKIQGIGAGFVPEVLDTKIIDEIVKVKNEDAFKAGKLVADLEGVLVGISSGAALNAAIELAKKDANKGKNIYIIFPDTGERYLSTPLFE